MKRYEPRTHTYRGRTETSYTTLDSIAKFIAREQRKKALTGKRSVESLDRSGRWWCMATLYSTAPMPPDEDDRFFDGTLTPGDR